jgi:hypothetical protein
MEEMFRDVANFVVWPQGGCACQFGSCIRRDVANGVADFYEPHEPRLKAAGLPWFYFTHPACLNPTALERMLSESAGYWHAPDEGESVPLIVIESASPTSSG